MSRAKPFDVQKYYEPELDELKEKRRAAQEAGKTIFVPCVVSDPDIWFPKRETVKGGKLSKETQLAMAMCQQCSIIDTCLALAFEQEVQVGIWGGLAAREREEILQQAEGGDSLAS